MVTLRWTRDDLVARSSTFIPEELAEVSAVVVDGLSTGDSHLLPWTAAAPCVVIACAEDGIPAPVDVDVVLAGDDRIRLPSLLSAIEANPGAARVLAEVLRVTPCLGVADGLVVESHAYSLLLAGPEFAVWLASRTKRGAKERVAAPVRSERDGATLRLTLNRPETRNAFSAAMRDALVEELQHALVDDEIASVVLDAEGPVFSSGGDLTEFGTTSDVVRAHEIRNLRNVGRLLDALGRRAEVRVRGACVGAGVELSAFASRVVAEPGTTFRLPEVAMGLVPGAGGTVSVTRRIGRHRTAELALSGRTMELDEALAVGLVDAVRGSAT